MNKPIQMTLDCTGCKHRPTLADAQEGTAFCIKFQDMPQNGLCMQHSQYDAAKAVGEAFKASVAVGTPKHLSSPRPRPDAASHAVKVSIGGRTGEYLHLPNTNNLPEMQAVSL